ncbi:heme-binding protein [Paracoccaceae bacterium Fryx2]|nr:heme-binding protein [Paracoccaceae bacterium Fryx2]
MRWIMVLALAVALMPGVPQRAEAEMYKGTETAAYQVVRKVGPAELRRYDSLVVAEVTAEGDRAGAANRGFRVLAGYIFGGNAGSAKIAMTTPVAQAPAGEKIAMTTPVAQMGSGTHWTVRFTMPGTYRLDTLPKPEDSRIRLFETPPRRVLVLGFSGTPTAAALDRATASLRAIAKAERLETTGMPEFLFYDSPFTLPWNRRNEVALTLR